MLVPLKLLPSFFETVALHSIGESAAALGLGDGIYTRRDTVYVELCTHSPCFFFGPPLSGSAEKFSVRVGHGRQSEGGREEEDERMRK